MVLTEKNCVLLNSLEEIIEIKSWLLLVVCINGGARPLFRLHFFRFFNIDVFLLETSICKFLTLFILFIYSFYTSNVNFVNILLKSGLSPPFIHTTLT